ncbi:MAG: TIGR04283 family arsenosugar biosynthesis glycosyltransferase [Pseudomonadota bacterium]
MCTDAQIGGFISSIMPVSIIIPALNEAETLPATLASLARLDPAPAEIVLVDGGSTDATAALAREAGARVVAVAPPGRARQMNAGAAEARGDVFCFLHADTVLPADFCALAERVLSERKTALAGFYSIMRGPTKTRWATSFHNYIKTWYAPLLFRPLSFFRGCRLLFGDQVMICRRADFEAIGGFDNEILVMEEADLCLRMVRAGRGKVRMINRHVWSSDRRVAKWGPLRANLTYLYVGIVWGLGGGQRHLRQIYKDVR